MRKFLTICFILLIILSCERPDLTEDLRESYLQAEIDLSNSDSTSDDPCKTIVDGNMWSSLSTGMTLRYAVSFCNNFTECGYSDWHLPTISELRTLIQNCPETELGGTCSVTDFCLEDTCYNNACNGCGFDFYNYSKLDDEIWLWSSSTSDNSSAWCVNFGNGRVMKEDYNNYSDVRCVRSGNTDNPCDPNPCSGITNSNGTCTVNGKKYVCGCNDGYIWDGSICDSPASCTIIDGKMWSSKALYEKTWEIATWSCENLTECGYSDWHLPTISELRTLIQNWSNTEINGSCGVTDSCLSSTCKSPYCDGDGASDSNSLEYSKLGDTGEFWSSSPQSDNSDYAWYVNFSFGAVRSDDIYSGHNFRCVR